MKTATEVAVSFLRVHAIGAVRKPTDDDARGGGFVRQLFVPAPGPALGRLLRGRRWLFRGLDQPRALAVGQLHLELERLPFGISAIS